MVHLAVLPLLGLVLPAQAQEPAPSYPAFEGTVNAIAHDAEGNTYLGGDFTTIYTADFPYFLSSGALLNQATGGAIRHSRLSMA
jgi:hypothetical protein